ncbi:MAG: hypothetical protein DRP26_02360 [Candidatus Zixiibacteriota bacterium]|nr:MAG: hypothetical protein DRP26_02360 [candidate division Zixibacteria bacterium]
MQGKFRKYAIYVVFVVAVAYGINFHFLRDNHIPDKEKNKPSQDGITQDYKEKVSLGTAFNLPKSWGRNPFGYKENIVENSDGNPINKVNGIPSLTGISYNKEGMNYAIIDNKVVQEGDEINDWKVLLIRMDYVKIKNAGVVKKLNLRDSN